MQISGAWSAEVPTDRFARLVAAEIIEYLGSAEVLDALGAAIAGRMSATYGQTPAEPATDPQADRGGFPVGGRHQAPGDEHYDRGADL